MDKIPELHERVVKKFHTHTTRPLAYRLKQLRQLYWVSLMRLLCSLDALLSDGDAMVIKLCRSDNA